jgi:hypothetical protein
MERHSLMSAIREGCTLPRIYNQASKTGDTCNTCIILRSTPVELDYVLLLLLKEKVGTRITMLTWYTLRPF